MSQDTKIIMNHIPVNTWRWLGVNHASMEKIDAHVKTYDKDIYNNVDYSNWNGIVSLTDEKNMNNIEFIDGSYEGIESNLYKQVQTSYNTGFYIKSEVYSKTEDPIVIQYEIDDENKAIVDHNIIIAEEDSEITVVVRYNSKVYGYHNGMTSILGKKNSIINLIKIQTLNEESTHVDSIYTKLEENAKVNYVIIELGAKRSITNYHTDLEGVMSCGNLSTAYIMDKDRKIDMNYQMNHMGIQSRSDIDVKGALLDQADKIFRGTINLRKGAKKAVGKEEEYAILLSDTVRNRSVPILLCTEDDVEGQHAASTGKIDENKLFYLMSRGLSELEAKKLIIEASLTPIIDMIPLDTIKDEVNEYVRRKIVGE
jgi:FeS assembly protein SufD